MALIEKLNLGIVGACGRGQSFKAGCDALPDIRIHAVCDTDAAGLEKSRQSLGAAESYTDYETMLSRSELDAVVIATPMHLHAPQAIEALSQNIHVLSEVTAAVSLDQARALVAACRTSKAIYALAENCNYTRANVLVRHLVQAGLFGQTYYAEGEYLHELKALNERTPWRRQWQTGIDGVTYGTHSLGPILQWMPSDRVVSVCCAGSGRHYQDPKGQPYAQDTSVLLGKMATGGLVKIRVDMLSERPPVTCTYQLQGTAGCYESARAPTESDRIWLRDRCPDPNTWIPLANLEEEFLPAAWRTDHQAGHGGSDLYAIADFTAAIRDHRPPQIAIDAAMDMTLPGLISQQSIANDSQWLPVPDSRTWK